MEYFGGGDQQWRLQERQQTAFGSHTEQSFLDFTRQTHQTAKKLVL
jgi:hypothetical protein